VEQKRLVIERGRTERMRRSAIAERAAKTRYKNKLARGQCPCCKATFTDLAEHIKSEHPDFAEGT
jgi:hypothetical protein